MCCDHTKQVRLLKFSEVRVLHANKSIQFSAPFKLSYSTVRLTTRCILNVSYAVYVRKFPNVTKSAQFLFANWII